MTPVTGMRPTELLIAGMFQCVRVLLDRIVENGVLERIEIDAALQAVEDGFLAETHLDEEARQWLSLPANLLRTMSAKNEQSVVMTTRDLEDAFRFRRST